MHKTYKKPSSQNRRVKVVTHEKDSGMLNSKIQSQRNPIVCLPEYVASPIFTKYQRFITTSAIDSFVNIANCLDQFMVQVSTALGICYVKAFRIKKIRILCPVTTQGTSVSCKLTPSAVDSGSNSFNCCPETFIDTSASIDIPAYIHLSPSLDTPMGSWHNSSGSPSQTLFEVKCPAGSTLDILFEYILNNEGAASTYTNTLVTGTVGELYARAIAGASFVPIQLNLR